MIMTTRTNQIVFLNFRMKQHTATGRTFVPIIIGNIFNDIDLFDGRPVAVCDPVHLMLLGLMLF